MSNNIYDILKKMAGLEAPKAPLTESKSMATVKELHKESKKESTAKTGSIAEAVKTVESQLNEKYMGFKKTIAAIKKGGSAENPEAVAAAIGRKKYGKEKFQKAAAAGKKLGEGDRFTNWGPTDPYEQTRRDNIYAANKLAGQEYERSPAGKAAAAQMKADDEAWLKKSAADDAKIRAMKKQSGAMEEGIFGDDPLPADYFKQGPKNWSAERQHGPVNPTFKQRERLDALRQSTVDPKTGKEIPGRAEELAKGYDAVGNKLRFPAGTSDMEMIKQTAKKIVGMDEGEYNEDLLSPKQKEFAKLAPPPDKITYADKIAGAKRGKKTEGNKFSGNLAKARAQGLKQADLDGDGDMEKVTPGKSNMREGWEEMQKYLEKKRGPESKGGAGKKEGSRYGGSKQKDDDEELDGEGKPAVKKKGRPKGTGGGAKHSFKKPKD